MTTEAELVDCIEACRTCGVFFLTTSNFLRKIFCSTSDDPDMNLIRMELTSWNIEINENDGFPQYICTGCILDFQKVFKFRRSCIEMQQQLRHFYNLRQANNANASGTMVQVKTELPDPDEVEQNNMCDFIYVDDLSDVEYDGATPFSIPHVPIKDELIEEATVPNLMKEEPLENETEECKSTEINAQMDDRQSITLQPSEEPDHFPVLHMEAVQALQETVLTTPLAAPSKQREHVAVRDFECHICGKEFKKSTATRLKFHIKWHKISKHIKCVQCGFFCGSRASMREHVRVVHPSSKCPECGKLVFAKKMKSHMRGHQLASEENRMNVVKLFCSFCVNSFNSESELEQHIWHLHAREQNNSNNPNPIAMETSPTEAIETPTAYEIDCAFCEEKFTQRSDLVRHWREAQHNGTMPDFNEISTEENCKSKECKTGPEDEDETEQLRFKNYDSPTDSTKADDSATEKSSAYEYPRIELQNFVNNCKQQFDASAEKNETTRMENTKVFEQSHVDSDEKNYSEVDSNSSDSETDSMASMPLPQLQQSDTSFAAAATDGSEMHHYVCAQCTQTFNTIAALCAHYETHVQKPKFSCHICGKSFDLKFSLNRHLKKHKKAPF